MHAVTACYRQVQRLRPTRQLRAAPRLRAHLRHHPPGELRGPWRRRLSEVGHLHTPHPTQPPPLRWGHASAYRYRTLKAFLPQYACGNGVLSAGPATPANRSTPNFSILYEVVRWNIAQPLITLGNRPLLATWWTRCLRSTPLRQLTGIPRIRASRCASPARFFDVRRQTDICRCMQRSTSYTTS